MSRLKNIVKLGLYYSSLVIATNALVAGSNMYDGRKPKDIENKINSANCLVKTIFAPMAVPGKPIRNFVYTFAGGED